MNTKELYAKVENMRPFEVYRDAYHQLALLSPNAAKVHKINQTMHSLSLLIEIYKGDKIPATETFRDQKKRNSEQCNQGLQELIEAIKKCDVRI